MTASRSGSKEESRSVFRRAARPTPDATAERSSAEALRTVRELEESLARRRAEIRSARTAITQAEATAAQLLADARIQADGAAAALHESITADAQAAADRLASTAESHAERVREVAQQRRAADVARLVELVLTTSRADEIR